MSITVYTGLSQAAQGAAIRAVNALFNNPGSPILDNTGAVFSPTVQAAFADVPPSNAQILVHIEDGPVELFDADGLAGFDDVNQVFKHVAYMPNSKIVFTLDAPKEQLRKLMVDALRWGLMTAYAVDVNGYRLESYLLRWMAQYGIHRIRNKPLFDAPEYNPPNLAAPRPQGLVFSARVVMRANIETVWYSPPANSPGSVINMAPTGAAIVPFTIPGPT